MGTVGIRSSSIKGNTILYPAVSGIALEARCDNSSVTGNTVVGDGVSIDGKGVQVNDSRGVTVSGNAFYNLAAGVIMGGGPTSGSWVVTAKLCRVPACLWP